MTTREINAMLALRGERLVDIAAKINAATNPDPKITPDRISQTINYLRENKDVRLALAKYFKMKVSDLFDENAFVGPAKYRQMVAAQGDKTNNLRKSA